MTMKDTVTPLNVEVRVSSQSSSNSEAVLPIRLCHLRIGRPAHLVAREKYVARGDILNVKTLFIPFPGKTETGPRRKCEDVWAVTHGDVRRTNIFCKNVLAA